MYFLRTHFLSFTPSISAISAMLLGDLQNVNTLSWGEMSLDWGCNSSSLGVLLGVSMTFCPSIYNDGANPNISHPPSELRNAQAVSMPLWSSPVVFFNSKVRVSFLEISFFISSIVIISLLPLF